MNDLIKINYESDNPTISARELYDGLDIKSNLSTWPERMAEYGVIRKSKSSIILLRSINRL